MRVSNLFGKTLREMPAEADTVSHQLLLRAGMIHQVATGVYAYLPMGWRALRKIEQIIREELDAVGSQEVMMPALQPYELWEKSGRQLSFGRGLFTLYDRKERRLCLGPTHEEVITELVHYNVQSYRDLPLLLYQIQTKFRDEPRPRGGLLRVREFTMMDLYSFDVDSEATDISYRKMIQAYNNIYRRCGLPTIMVEADSGAIGGKDSHEFMVVTEAGEDEVIHCPNCGYAANSEKAQSTKVIIPADQVSEHSDDGRGDGLLPLEELATPGVKTIEEVASFVGVSASKTLKAVFYSADTELVLVIIRGDLEVNETKLRNVLGCSELRLATESELDEAQIVAGFASPVGAKLPNVVADDSITLGSNFIVGANKEGYHFINANYPRDFKVDLMVDIALACSGDSCIKCHGVLSSARAIEVGHVFKLGTFLSEKLGAFFLDRDSISKPAIMGCYGIGLGRLLSAIVEQSHDDKGIIWPLSGTPYQVHLCPLYSDKIAIAPVAERIYAELEDAGIGVLFDDRGESPGVKFNDADLLGIPLRLTFSPRTLQNQAVEVKWRVEKGTWLLQLENLASELSKLLREQ